MVGLCKRPDCGIKKSNNDESREVTAEQYLKHCCECRKLLGATKNDKEMRTAHHR